MNKLIVNFTPTGMIPTKEQTPFVPVRVQEIVDDVRAACLQGITMVHLHARDEQDQKPTYKREIYRIIISGIRDFAPDLIVCVSTSGRTYSSFEQRSDALRIDMPYKPDMASLTLSSLNFNSQSSINEPEMIKKLAGEMLDLGIKPELEVFDLGMINYAHYLIRKGYLKPPYYFNIILGNIACAQADLMHMGLMLKELPPDSYVSFGGVGDAQFLVNSIAIASGYGIRVGLEDNIWFDAERTQYATNRDLIARTLNMAAIVGRPVMSSAELRLKLNL